MDIVLFVCTWVAVFSQIRVSQLVFDMKIAATRLQKFLTYPKHCCSLGSLTSQTVKMSAMDLWCML